MTQEDKENQSPEMEQNQKPGEDKNMETPVSEGETAVEEQKKAEEAQEAPEVPKEEKKEEQAAQEAPAEEPKDDVPEAPPVETKADDAVQKDKESGSPAAEKKEGAETTKAATKNKKINKFSLEELEKKIEELEKDNNVKSKFYRHLKLRKDEISSSPQSPPV